MSDAFEDVTITMTRDHSQALIQALRRMSREEVLVGIPAGPAEFRMGEPGETGPVPSNAMIGYINEFGMPERNIPARPHLVPGVQLALDAIIEIYDDALTRALSAPTLGDISLLQTANEAAGMTAASSVQSYILTADLQPLAPYTIRRRQERGRFGTRPLVDTSQYVRSITYVVRRRVQP